MRRFTLGYLENVSFGFVSLRQYSRLEHSPLVTGQSPNIGNLTPMTFTC